MKKSVELRADGKAVVSLTTAEGKSLLKAEADLQAIASELTKKTSTKVDDALVGSLGLLFSQIAQKKEF